MQHFIPKYRQPTTHANKIHAAIIQKYLHHRTGGSWCSAILKYRQLISGAIQKYQHLRTGVSWCNAIWKYQQLNSGAIHGSSPVISQNIGNIQAVQTKLFQRYPKISTPYKLVLFDLLPSGNIDNLLLVHSMDHSRFIPKSRQTYKLCKQRYPKISTPYNWCILMQCHLEILTTYYWCIQWILPITSKNNDNLPAIHTILIHNLVSTCKGATSQRLCQSITM
jgi:hypothetical protein